LLYYNYRFIYLYKGYASYIHISRGYVKHKRLRTTYGYTNLSGTETKERDKDMGGIMERNTDGEGQRHERTYSTGTEK
jgi:hypothetical protein